MPTKYADVQNYATYYYYVGKTTLPDVIPDFSRGRRLLMIHAAGSNGHFWHYQYDGLGRVHSPVALDLPGHGRSSGVEGLSSVQEYANFVARFLDTLKIDATVLVGHSMGGAVALDFAVRYPSRVQGLVLLATSAKFAIQQDLVDTWHAVTMGRMGQPFNNAGYSPKTVTNRPEVIREGWGEQIRTDPRVRWGDIVACTKVDLRDQLARISQPTLIIAGADDETTPPAMAEALKAGIKGSRLEVIADAGHFMTIEQPTVVNSAIEQFLDGLR